MATKIKVKKITDLTKIVAEQGTEPDDSKVIFSGDQLVVAHKTNVDDAGGGIMHSTAMEVQELLKYISRQLESKYMTLEAGGQLSSLVESKLREAEDNMAKGNDVYSSNYFVDDAGVTKFNGTAPNEVDNDNNISSWYSGTYIFKSTSTANVHLTIYNSGAASSATKPAGQAYAKIQMRTKSGWKTICQQPLQCADGAFDVDLHGYFFAGTKLRGAIEQQSIGNVVNFSMSNMQVTRFSSESGFSNKSFDWWVSNNGALTSDTNPPDVISAPGFLSFTGLYWTTTRDGISTADSIVGSKATDYIVNKNFSRHYCTNAVYANVRYEDGQQYILGCTENDNIAYTKNSGINDDFSGKYYYITPSNSNYVSAFTTTDFMFKDDPKAPKADSGGGFRNATLIKYTDYDEISTVAGTHVETDDTGKSETVPNKVYTYTEITAKYNSPAESPHKFKYSGGLGYWLSVDANDCNNKKFYQYVGANQRNIAALEIVQYTDSSGCYVKESQDSWNVAGTGRGNPPPAKYAFLPTSLGSQRIKSIIRDDDENKWKDSGDGRQYQPVNYEIDVLNENVEYIGVGKDIANYQTTFTPVSSFPSAAAIDNWLTAEVSAGWALTGVELAAADGDNPLTIKNFAFAACPRLSTLVFPANVAATGVYTFAAPSKTLSYIEAGGTYGNNKLSVVTPKAGTPAAQNMSRLASVVFHKPGNDGPRTHIEGYTGHPGETVAMFSNCRNLTSVNLEDTDIQNLGTYSFLNCMSLPSIEIPQTCTGLGASVFEGCSSLTSITFPSTLQSFKRLGTIGKPSVVDFKSCSPNLIYKNTITNSSSARDSYKYALDRNYVINIKLLSAYSDYRGDGTLDGYRANIFPEISALVNYLNAQGLGATTNTVFKKADGVVNGITTYGNGRRYYLLDKDNNYINLTNEFSTNSSDQQNLTFNTIATEDTVPSKNMIVPSNTGSEDTWTGKQVTEAYCVMYC